jgi:hypothetical protein
VDVAVTTPGGQTPLAAADRFTYVPGIPPNMPGITSVTPASGPRTGRTRVSISGRGLSGATAVDFGVVPARSFAVNSDSSITAVSPPEPPGTVDVTVRTPGAQTPLAAADRFNFVQVCVVPTLTGKTLKGAKRALTKAHCKLGKVKAEGHTTGKVSHQSRQSGTVLPAGSKVNLRVG